MMKISEAHATLPPVLPDYSTCVDSPLSSESQNRCWSCRLACSCPGKLAEPRQEVPSDTVSYFFLPFTKGEKGFHCNSSRKLIIFIYIPFFQHFCARHWDQKWVRKMNRSSQPSRGDQSGNEWLWDLINYTGSNRLRGLTQGWSMIAQRRGCPTDLGVLESFAGQVTFEQGSEACKNLPIHSEASGPFWTNGLKQECFQPVIWETAKTGQSTKIVCMYPNVRFSEREVY